MKIVAIVLFVIASGMAVKAQGHAQQTTFGSETEIVRPATVSISILKKIGAEDWKQAEKCQKDDQFREKALSDHFLASALNVQTLKGKLDLLVIQANSICFWGAHNTHIWILAKGPGEKSSSYRKIFDVQTDWLEVSTRSRRSFPDLKLFSHTAVELYVTTLRYSSGSYREVKCDVQMMGDDSPKPRTISCKKYNWEFREKEASSGS